MEESERPRHPAIIPPGAGRAYPMGRLLAIFKADLEQTDSRYSISEWVIEPRSLGPLQHSQPEDHVYYVISGTLSVCISDSWEDLPPGSYAIIPGGTPHTFENRSPAQTRFIAFNTPGGVEAGMPEIAAAVSTSDLGM